MSAPIHRMKKDEMVWYGTHKCQHGHTYLEHWQCALDELEDKLRIGYFDIEASNLKADFGFMISWYILDGDGKYHGRTITPREVLCDDPPDKELLKELVDCFNSFDVIYTYYGTGFDLPFVRTRSIIAGVKFPYYGSLKHKDTFYIIKNKFNMSRRSLENACQVLLGRTNKTHWMGKHWTGAVQGKEDSLRYIDDHCRKDVKDLKDLTELAIDYVMPTVKSI
jgi:DNA polymerase elongation subunit (family B)